MNSCNALKKGSARELCSRNGSICGGIYCRFAEFFMCKIR